MSASTEPTSTTKIPKSARRGNGEGSINKRADGRYQACYTADGKRHFLYGKTRAEVAKKLAATLRDRDKGLPVGLNERQTTQLYLTSWLDMMRPTLRPQTWKRYHDLLMLHVAPTLGNVPITKLTAQHIQRLYAIKLAEGLSPTTVHHLGTVLHGALAKAERLGVVARNVAELVDTPRIAHHDMQVLDAGQVRTLLEAVRGDRLEALYVLAITTGMRQGELLALRWRDVDLTSQSLQVRATLHRTKEHGYVLAAPKTKQSQRRIKLSNTAVEALHAHRVRQHAERLALGPAWDDTLDLVFRNTVGKPQDVMNLLHYHFYPLLKRAGLPRIRFHDLRHTAATLLLGRGINPKIVSEMLGHASISITLDTYSHVLPDMQDQAAAAMDAALGS